MIHTIIALFLLSSCSYFEEEEILLQGKRVEVFKKKEEKLIKSRLSVKLPESINIDEWPMQNQNIANKISHFKANESIKIKWIKKISKEKFDENISVTKPIIFDNKILLISNDLEVKAINLKNNKILWQTKLEDEFDEDFYFIGGIAGHKKKLIITSGMGNLYSLNISNGNLNWKKNFLKPIASPPLIFSDKIFFITDDNQTFAVNFNNGEKIWSHSGNIENLSILGGVSPSFNNETLLVTYTSGEIYAINSNNGGILWFENLSVDTLFSKNLISDIQSSPVIHKNKVLVSSYINKFLSLQLKDGQISWEVKLSTINPIVTAGNNIFIVDSENKLHCLDDNTGGILWSAQLKTKNEDDIITWYGPLLVQNKLILASSEGAIISISPFTGGLLGVIKTKHVFKTHPILANKTIFFLSKDGNLVALE
tara:strand:- start:421 stop:1695 length:1275 start_codon:yes stop_codon:yes gene_type:complete